MPIKNQILLAIIRVVFIALDLLSVIHRCAGVYPFLRVYAMPVKSLLERADNEEAAIEEMYDEISEELGIPRGEMSNIASYEKKAKKNYFVTLLENILCTVETQRDIVKKLRLQADQLKTEALQSQARVISLQEELLKSKDEQLMSVQTAVKDGVSAGIKSYSSVAGVNSQQTTQPAPPQTRSVVKDAFVEEERSRSLMVYGLEEEENEELEAKVGLVFQELGVKPRIEAVRLGREATEKTRAVKVTLSNSTVAHQILMRSAHLKQSENFRTVFIAPDRSLKQRVERRELVERLKKKVVDDPSKHYYIRNREIHSRVKSD